MTTPHEEQPDQAEQVLGEVAGDYSDLDPGTRPTDEEHPLWVLLGGPWGAVESMAPTVLFAAAYLVSGDDLGVAVVVALVAAAVLALVRVWRKERPVRVLSGLVGVTVAALFAAWRGSPEAFFTIRVLANVLSALAFAISIFIRRPLLGIIVGPIMGTGMRWRKDPALLKAYSRATWLWVGLSLVRAAIQVPLIIAGNIMLLGATPFLFYGLVALTIAGSWWIIKATLPPGHPGIRQPVIPAD